MPSKLQANPPHISPRWLMTTRCGCGIRINVHITAAIIFNGDPFGCRTSVCPSLGWVVADSATGISHFKRNIIVLTHHVNCERCVSGWSGVEAAQTEWNEWQGSSREMIRLFFPHSGRDEHFRNQFPTKRHFRTKARLVSVAAEGAIISVVVGDWGQPQQHLLFVTYLFISTSELWVRARIRRERERSTNLFRIRPPNVVCVPFVRLRFASYAWNIVHRFLDRSNHMHSAVSPQTICSSCVYGLCVCVFVYKYSNRLGSSRMRSGCVVRAGSGRVYTKCVLLPSSRLSLRLDTQRIAQGSANGYVANAAASPATAAWRISISIPTTNVASRRTV